MLLAQVTQLKGKGEQLKGKAKRALGDVIALGAKHQGEWFAAMENAGTDYDVFSSIHWSRVLMARGAAEGVDAAAIEALGRLQVVHAVTPRDSRHSLSLSSPRRTQALAVPSGAFSELAISVCTIPR